MNAMVLEKAINVEYAEVPIKALSQGFAEEFNCPQRSGKWFSHAKTPSRKEDLELIQHKVH